MRLAISLAAVVASSLTAATAVAQGQAPTTVQLPTFSFFTVSTSVSVPDSGGAYLGGINRARDSSVVRGLGPLLANRGIASDRAASGMSVHATIIDLKEMDDRILAEAAAMRGPVDPALAKAELLTRHVGRGELPAVESKSIAPVTSPASVAAIRQANLVAAATRNSEAAEYFAKARQAEADNKPAVAKIYYQMVARRDGGELVHLAQARLAALVGANSSGGKSAAVAAR